jgi:hypothetical protein
MAQFSELQTEVKRRALRNQSGSEYTTAIKTAINAGLARIAREALWRVLRREATVTTVLGLDSGVETASVTNGSASVTLGGDTIITDNGVNAGRKITFSGSNKTYKIKLITEVIGSTFITLDTVYDSDTSSTVTYTILPQEEYNLPIQASHRMFMWHNEFGYPQKMQYITDQQFRSLGIDDETEDIPTHYRMWGENMVINQPNALQVVSVVSSDSSDTSISITVFGDVGGYPDSETILTNASDGTTVATGSKSFSNIDRVTKNESTVGRITASTDSQLTTLAVLPAGNATSGIMYSKIQIWPLPNSIFPINVQFYKDPYKLVNDKDIHEMGEEFDEAIILIATAKLKYETNQKEGDRFVSLWTDEIKSLKRTNVDKPDFLRTLKRAREEDGRDPLLHSNLSYRQLGGNYGPRTRR